MANSLQDQLLKAGLVSEQNLKQAKTKQRKGKRAGGGQSAESAQRSAEAQRAAAEKRQHDQELNRQREEERRRKADIVALWQLVHDNRVPRGKSDIAYNFADGTALKRIYVKAEQQQAIAAGTLAIVRHESFYELVPQSVAERALEVDPATLVLWNRPQPGGADADPYADFEVPDDLMW
ncbi:DUF2058 domain-containing protein [Thiohalocapsa sp. ML1]|jgi:uncharacterized protein|uniref:DUF2058 domain-containing protein n=1 Tax=Thiohalocapsa sp. ML1 TaxID=1431688 RepID=UPI00073200D6|nr:DUF2058 domain-containing protein [Thiohalocapsa sp. ML1]